MSLTPCIQPDCRAIDLSRFRQLVAGQDDSAFPSIDAGYNTAQVKPRTVESWDSRLVRTVGGGIRAETHLLALTALAAIRVTSEKPSGVLPPGR